MADISMATAGGGTMPVARPVESSGWTVPALADRGRVDAAAVIGIGVALMTIGVLMTFSASMGRVRVDFTGDLTDAPAFRQWIRQAAYVPAGLLLMLVASRIPYTIWRWRPGRLLQPAVLLFLLAVVLLALAFVPGIGKTANGARRWIRLVPPTDFVLFQPSELAKLSLVVLLSAWYASGTAAMLRVRGFFRGTAVTCLMIGLLAGLVAKEDLGTGALLAAIGGMLFFAAGARFWHLMLLGLSLGFGMWHHLTSRAYRMERLTMFTRIWDDTRDRGYHQVQSLGTIVSGGWWGRGLGQGIQKYGYLPETTNDSVFAVLCEELGMPGALLVIGLFLALLCVGWRVMRHCADRFGRLLALGITLLIVMQAAFNIAVVTVSVPTKGIALPLISAGGSGLLCLSVMMGILANIARHRAPALEH